MAGGQHALRHRERSARFVAIDVGGRTPGHGHVLDQQLDALDDEAGTGAAAPAARARAAR